MSRLFRESHAFIFTSLRNRFGTVVLEAMGHGLPILTLDHNGVRSFVPNDGGIKVPVTNPKQTVAGLAAGIDRLAASQAHREQMGAAALAYARTRTWRLRCDELVRIYADLVDVSPASPLRAKRGISSRQRDPSLRLGMKGLRPGDGHVFLRHMRIWSDISYRRLNAHRRL